VSFAGLLSAEVNATNQTTSTNNSFNNTRSSWVSRCAAVEHRVEGKITMFEQNRDPHFTRFTRLSAQLDQIINKSYTKGYNITVLDNDIALLNEKISQFQNDYSLFIQKLQNTRNFTCGHSEGQFQAALNASKTQLKILRQDAEDIKKFYDEIIKKDIAQLREQKKAEAEKRKVEREQNRTRASEVRPNKNISIEERSNKTRAITNQSKERGSK